MSAAEDKERAIHNVINSLAATQQISQAFVQLVTQRETLTQNQLMLLLLLRLTGSLNITNVSDTFSITPGAASFMCDKLEGLGLVERVRTKEDRRVVNIVLTEQGEQRIIDLFAAFPTQQLEKIAKTLEKIHQLMAEIVN